MVNEITKAELQAMIDVQNRSATQMEKVAASLNTIVENQKVIIESLSGCSLCKGVINTMSKDITFLRWSIASVISIVAIGMVIIKLFHL